MKLRHSIYVATGCILLLAGAAAAEIERVGVEVSPFVGALYLDPHLGYTESMAPTLGARFGVALTPRLTLEAQGSWARFATRRRNVVRDADLGLASGALSVDLTGGSRVRPFVTLGAGYAEDLGTGAAGALSQPFAAVGGGFKIASAGGLGVRLEAQQLLMTQGTPTGRDVLQNTSVGARVILPFARQYGDVDGDGVRDNRDACASTPTGAHVDPRGCPVDADGDGVPDGIDVCMNTVAGAHVDPRGCPVDADGDGVADGIDVCMNTPAGAQVDPRGCPVDADGDGVPDGIDVCMNTPAGAQVDGRGCPLDSDGDGVADAKDRCPNTAAGTKVDETGCEVSKLEYEMLDTGRLRLPGVTFMRGSAQLEPASSGMLDQAGQILSRWPQLQIEIGGHTDARGSATRNRVLSERRAQAVADYLLAHFAQISSSQLRVRGYGKEQPIADNMTVDGRAKNRRVELMVMNREELRQVK